MSSLSKKVIIGSMAAAGLVAAICAVDLAIGIPFKRLWIMDLLFLLSAGVVLYMAYDAYQDLK